MDWLKVMIAALAVLSGIFLVAMSLTYIFTSDDVFIEAMYGGMIFSALCILFIIYKFKHILGEKAFYLYILLLIVFIVSITMGWIVAHVVEPIFNTKIILLLCGVTIGVFITLSIAYYITYKVDNQQNYEQDNIYSEE